MWSYPEQFDLIVIGGGHAGCEAAHAGALMGARTLLLTMNLDTIGKMSCNPAIGGTAKGHIVREIDALGGVMGKIADRTGIHFRMLNASKGPAVWSPRAQSDRLAYQIEMKKSLEEVPSLEIKQGTITSLGLEKGAISGVETLEGVFYPCRAVVLSAGTFMRGLLHVGASTYSGGRAGDKTVTGLSKCLEDLGFRLERLKTGTPPRLRAQSIDFSKTEEQLPEKGVRFSFDPQANHLSHISCFITYTNKKTAYIVEKNLHRSPLFSGKIKGVGPRYCPSIEDKIVRFPNRSRHQIFLEPEGLQTREVYANGISSSLPSDVQSEMIKTIPGLEHAQIMRFGYAIEYDYVASGQIDATLKTHAVEGLYLAGQVNGTTGYEEAAAQGLMAGINAVLSVRKKPSFILKRSESYIGVMVDDLVSKELDEPYRMFTSRAEHRLLLRQDNADLRLRGYGKVLGLISETQCNCLEHKRSVIAAGTALLERTCLPFEGKSFRLADLLKRPDFSYEKLRKKFPDKLPDYGEEVNTAIEIDLKYAGYIEREKREIEKLSMLETSVIPKHFDYESVIGLRHEAREKLTQRRPHHLGQAVRISGVSPSDISILMVSLKKMSLGKMHTDETNTS